MRYAVHTIVAWPATRRDRRPRREDALRDLCRACRFMFVPFGQGPRVCIGQHFSLMESRVVLAMLLQRFNLHLQRPYKITWRPMILPSQPEGGVPVTVELRT